MKTTKPPDKIRIVSLEKKLEICPRCGRGINSIYIEPRESGENSVRYYVVAYHGSYKDPVTGNRKKDRCYLGPVDQYIHVEKLVSFGLKRIDRIDYKSIALQAVNKLIERNKIDDLREVAKVIEQHLRQSRVDEEENKDSETCSIDIVRINSKTEPNKHGVIIRLGDSSYLVEKLSDYSIIVFRQFKQGRRTVTRRVIINDEDYVRTVFFTNRELLEEFLKTHTCREAAKTILYEVKNYVDSVLNI